MTFLLELLVSVLIVLGGLFALIGSVGMVKLPDLLTRLHAPTKATTLGVGGALAASMVYFAAFEGDLSIHEILITAFLFLTAPISAHLMSRAALSLMDERPPHPERTPDPDDAMVDRDDPAPPER